MLRKRSVVPAIVATILLFAGSASFAVETDAKYAPGEIIIRLRPETVMLPTGSKTAEISTMAFHSDSIKALNAKHKVMKVKQAIKDAPKGQHMKLLRSGQYAELPDLSNIFVLEVPEDTDILSAVEEYKNDPNVIYAEPNYISHIFTTPNDPWYVNGDQWGLYKIGCNQMGSGESAWDITTGEVGTNVVTVAVVDTGINYNHEDLSPRTIIKGWDWVNNDNDPMDDEGHGTHVAGIIGAATNNGAFGGYRGVAGVDWNCHLVAIKCLDYEGYGYDDDIANGIINAVSKEADVINMSFGGSDSSTIKAALDYAEANDVVLIAAAGNSYSSSINYPAAYDNVLAVAATNTSDQKTAYSTFGSWVDVSAPGGENSTNPNGILSTYYRAGATSNEVYAWAAGTSMATPFVCGLAALIKGKRPTWTKSQIETQIKTYVDNIDAVNPSYAGLIGTGRINAFLALGGLHTYIGSPASGGTAYGVVEIKGTATGEGFSSYTVEYGKGNSPTTWLTLESNNPNTMLNQTIATLDTTGTEGDYTVKLSVNGLTTTETTVTFQAGATHKATLLSAAQNGPNPFDPLTGSTMIKYDLTSNANIQIYIFDMTGNLIWRKVYGAGSDGGWQGTNRIYWDGKNSFGDIVQNGAYIFKIVSGDRVIGSGKIIALQ